jgi:hypothetical protein
VRRHFCSWSRPNCPLAALSDARDHAAGSQCLLRCKLVRWTKALPEPRWPGALYHFALAQRWFRTDGPWADSRPGPTEHWREVCRGSRRNRRQDRPGFCHSTPRQPGRRVGVVCGRYVEVVVLGSHACCRSSRKQRRGTGILVHHRAPLRWLPFRFTLSAVGSPVFGERGTVPVDFRPLHTGGLAGLTGYLVYISTVGRCTQGCISP